MWIKEALRAEVTFEILLFSLFIVAFLYGLKNYIIPFVLVQMQALQEQLHYLLGRQELLSKLEKQLQEDAILQEERIASMRQKLHIWHTSCQERDAKQTEALQCAHAKTLKKRAMQTENLQKILMNKEALPLVMHQVSNDLEKQYRGNLGKNQLHELVESMAQKTSSKKPSR